MWSKKTDVQGYSLVFVVALALLGSAPAAAEDRQIAIIVSDKWTEIRGMSVAELQRVYLGKAAVLSGKTVTPVDQAGKSQIYAAFVAKALGMPRRRLEDYWLEQALSGGRRPPRRFASEDRIVAFVERQVGAIGYVSLAAVGPGVRALALRKGDRWIRPGEAGYPLDF